MKNIYIKTRGERWIKVKGALSGVSVKGGSRSVLVAETIDKPLVTGKPVKRIKIPSTKVTKVVYAMLNNDELNDLTVLIECIDEETCVIDVYRGDSSKVSKIIEEGLMKKGLRKLSR